MENPEEEEILENEPIKGDTRGIYTNKSIDGQANNGSRGKLNEGQLRERANLWAKFQITGMPSIKSIAQHWQTEYGITMHLQSEYEWGKNNQERINRAAAELEEDGKMPLVVVAPSTIASMLGKAGKDVVETLRSNKKTQGAIGSLIEDFTNPYQQIGAQNKETYWTSRGKQREEFDERLEHALKLNEANVHTYKVIADATVKQGSLLVDMMKVVTDLNKTGQTMDRAIEKKLKDEIKSMGLKQQERKELERNSPLDAVSDEDRAK